jgi:hypothetical protein
MADVKTERAPPPEPGEVAPNTASFDKYDAMNQQTAKEAIAERDRRLQYAKKYHDDLLSTLSLQSAFAKPHQLAAFSDAVRQQAQQKYAEAEMPMKDALTKIDLRRKAQEDALTQGKIWMSDADVAQYREKVRPDSEVSQAARQMYEQGLNQPAPQGATAYHLEPLLKEMQGLGKGREALAEGKKTEEFVGQGGVKADIGKTGAEASLARAGAAEKREDIRVGGPGARASEAAGSGLESKTKARTQGRYRLGEEVDPNAPRADYPPGEGPQIAGEKGQGIYKKPGEPASEKLGDQLHEINTDNLNTNQHIGNALRILGDKNIVTRLANPAQAAVVQQAVQNEIFELKKKIGVRLTEYSDAKLNHVIPDVTKITDPNVWLGSAKEGLKSYLANENQDTFNKVNQGGFGWQANHPIHGANKDKNAMAEAQRRLKENPQDPTAQKVLLRMMKKTQKQPQ